MPERGILDQLGVNLPPPPVGGIGGQAAKPPMAEMSQPADLGGIESLADTMVTGALMLLTQALPFYGTSEKGDGVIRAISTLKKVVPAEKMKEAEGNIMSLLSSVGRPGATAAPAPAPGMPAGGAPTPPMPGATPEIPAGRTV
jgi:hypothetical protein